MNKISKPGVYEGYSDVRYNGWERFSEYVTMRDGVKIAVDYYRPTSDGLVEEKPLPVVWIFTPYDYRTLLATGKFKDGTEYSPYIEEDIMGHAKLLVSHGYVFVVAEVRGTGASFGFRKSVNSDLEAWDGYELCKWLAEQSWSDGNIGTFGYLYFGATQMEMLRKNPSSLKAAFIGMTDLDKYDGWVRGGSLRAFGTQPDAAYLEDLKNIPVGTKETVEEKKLLEKVYLYGGWRDVFRRDTVMMYRNMRNARKMLFGPWWHMDTRPGFDIGVEKLRFFDYTLKGIENGIMDEQPVYYSTGNARKGHEWSFAESWLLKGTDYRSLFLTGGNSGTALSVNDGRLEAEAPVDEQDSDIYKVRYDINENIDNHLETSDRDKKGLTYTSEPLNEDIKITGHPIMDLWISSTSTDGDFIIHLIDVDENGKGTYITDGRLRASLRSVTKPPYDFAGMPWHRCNKADEHKLIPDKQYRLQIDLMPMSHLFRKGHRIRVTITCACQKIYFLQEEPAPVVKIYRNAVHTSYIKLPVVEYVNED